MYYKRIYMLYLFTKFDEIISDSLIISLLRVAWEIVFFGYFFGMLRTIEGILAFQ